MSREYTVDEIRDQFLGHVRSSVSFWLNEARAPTAKEKLEGLAFSIMVMLDGDTNLPAFLVAADPHPEDKAFYESSGENWYPPYQDDPGAMDIAGSLHELLWTQGK